MGSFLVTGGSGFIGRYLVGRLLKEKHRVIVVGRSERPMDAAAQYVRGNFGDLSLLEQIEQVNGVYHLAVNKDPSPSGHTVNVAWTSVLATWAAARNIPFFFYASSIEAQGPSADFRKQTFSDPCRPISAYGRTKEEAERAVREAFGETSSRIIIGRIGMTYGPGSPGFVQPMLEAVLSGGGSAKSFESMGDVRIQPIFVEDLVRLMVRTFDLNLSGDYYFSGQEISTVADWFRTVRALIAGVNGRIEWRDSTGSITAGIRDVLEYFSGTETRCQRLYDEGPLFERLGTECRVSMARGTAETLSWILNRL